MLNLNELKKFNNNGYIAYYIPDHHLASSCGIVYEHMLMAEKMLGRELRPGEVVHHKDRNRYNNSIDNLMVFKTNADHVAYHGGCEVVKDGDVYIAVRSNWKSKDNRRHLVNSCPVCGKEKDAYAKMCMDCRKKEKSKNIPPKEELYNLLLNHSMLAIGKMYGVSDNAVRKWCKKYSLPFKRNDIKKLREEYSRVA